MTSILQIIAGLIVMILQMFNGVAGSTVADQSWHHQILGKSRCPSALLTGARMKLGAIIFIICHINFINFRAFTFLTFLPSVIGRFDFWKVVSLQCTDKRGALVRPQFGHDFFAQVLSRSTLHLSSQSSKFSRIYSVTIPQSINTCTVHSYSENSHQGIGQDFPVGISPTLFSQKVMQPGKA